MPRVASTLILLLTTSHVTGMTGAYHHALMVCWEGVLITNLPRFALNHQPPNRCLPCSYLLLFNLWFVFICVFSSMQSRADSHADSYIKRQNMLQQDPSRDPFIATGTFFPWPSPSCYQFCFLTPPPGDSQTCYFHFFLNPWDHLKRKS
jgi:hypothetical protein